MHPKPGTARRLAPTLFAIALSLAAGTWLSVGEGWARPCRIKSPDVSVYGVRLADSESAERRLGTGATLVNSDDDLPHARFVSKNGAEELLLYMHYTAGPDEYAEVEVRYAGTVALTLDPLPVDSFVTGRGIALGMRQADVIRRFGTCALARERDGDSETLQYLVERADADPDLRTFGYKTYYAEYEFTRGRLVRYRFGFASP